VEVAYEWLPYFCTHCQNLGHDVTQCRWLYPRKNELVTKETGGKGKAEVPTKKLLWVPTKDIGSSKAFATPPPN